MAKKNDDPTIETDILTTAESGREKKRQNETRHVVNIGLAANAFLAALKLAAGIFGYSQALLADGVNSVSDVVYFIVVRIFVVFSAKPADPEHPYGHHQFESISAVVVGAFVITTGMAIFWDSVNTAFDMAMGTLDENPIEYFTIIVAIFTIITKVILMVNARRAARRTGSIAVSALARDHRNDVFASIGVSIGIFFGLIGLRWLDPLAGAAVAVLVTKTGVDILRESAADLMDTVPSRELDSEIRAVMTGFPDVMRVETIHAHRFGPYFVVNITIGIDGDLSVREGDRIADRVEEFLLDRIEMLRKIYVHYHPVEKRHKDSSF
ncbi:MAG: cation diffusion facilitator family transporter [Fibrobacterota bacterium]